MKALTKTLITFFVLLLFACARRGAVGDKSDALLEMYPDTSIGVGADALCTSGWEGTRTYAPVMGPTGRVAVIRVARCNRGGPVTEISPTVFVFVLDRGRAADIAHLAFSYDPLADQPVRLPRIKWGRNDSITIAVPLDTIEGILRRRHSIEGVRVVYELPGDFAPHATP